jgi:hypothetical protein
VIRDHVTLAMENLPRLMQRAVDLSPDIDGGGSLRLLRILYLEAPPWPTGFGDGEKALGLRQAVACEAVCILPDGHRSRIQCSALSRPYTSPIPRTMSDT